MGDKGKDIYIDSQGFFHRTARTALDVNQAVEDGGRNPTRGNCPQDPKKAVERRISQLSHKYGLDEEDKKAREILKLLNKALTLDKPLFDF